MAVIEDLSEEEACLLAILTDHSGLDLAECSTCGERKPPDAFRKARGAGTQNRKRQCLACLRAKQREIEARPKWLAYRKSYKSANRERIRSYMHTYQRTVIVQRKYGVTVEEIAAQVEAQEGRCPGCDQPLGGKSDVDHDHGSGDLRGILCPGCNKALGLLKESRATLLRLVSYLDQGGVWHAGH
jgi:DNA repair exonuclease SbcCD ATPase subunit